MYRKVRHIEKEPNSTNVHFTLKCPFAHELKGGQSVAHNGVCLTVVALSPQRYIHRYGRWETLDRSSLGDLKVGSLVNLERSVQLQVGSMAT